VPPTDDIWLNAIEAAAHFDAGRRTLSGGRAGLTPRAVRMWITRGHLPPARQHLDGVAIWPIAQLSAAERATRARALRLAGIGAT
jgi:hypothetical protein